MYDDIAFFIKIVKVGSFAEAAKCLGVSPATLTRRIQKLEKELNFILLKRDTHTLELSTAGQEIYNKFINFESDFTNVIASINKNNNELSGQINLLLPPFFALKIIIPYLSEFMLKYPKITLNIVYQNNLTVNLLKDNFDLAIIKKRPQKNSQKIRLLCRGNLIFYCYRDYLKEHSFPLTQKQVENELILGTMLDAGIIEKIPYLINKKTGKKKIFKLKHRILQNSGSHDQKLAQTWPTIGVGMDIMMQKELQSGEIVQILPDYYVPGFEYYLLINPAGKNARSSVFIDFIDDCIKRLNLDQNLRIQS